METSGVKKQIVDCCKRLWLRGLVANHDGNISYKISENEFITTPTSFSKYDITEEDLLLTDSSGKVLEGKHKVFSEFSLHRNIYSARSDIKCIVHGHPTAAGGIALSGHQMGTPVIPEAIVSLGRSIPTIKNSDVEIKSALRDGDAFLIMGNGAWTVGQNVLQTYLRLELVEQIAQALVVAKTFGGVKPLPQSQVEELLQKRPLSTATAAQPVSEVKQSMDDLSIKKLIQAELEKILAQK